MNEIRKTPCSLGRETILLGKQGEENALRLVFDCAEWLAVYPAATIKLFVRTPGEDEYYPVIGKEGTDRVWIVGARATKESGNGVIELQLVNENTGSVLKSATGYTTVRYSPSASTADAEEEAGYVRYDKEQILTEEQKNTARNNIGAGTGSGTGGGIAVETDPTVPDWAKQKTKPTYTAAEVGALPSTYTPPNQTAAQVGADPAGTAASAIGAHNVQGDAHEDIRQLIAGLTNRLNALADSDDTTLDQLSEIVIYIKSNKSLIDQITTGKVSVSDIVDNLTTNVAGKPLSAAQGVKLKALIDAIVIPTSLPNPQPIVINGESYDGSVKKEITIQPGSGTSVELDTTLTVSGKAADAKATGDAIAAEKQAREQAVNELKEANATQDERITVLEQNTPSGTSGLTVAQVNALDVMFQVAAYDATKNHAVAYKQFKIAFGLAEDDSGSGGDTGGGEDSGGEGGDDSGGTETVTYSVTTNLTDVEIDNATAIVNEGASYTATLTPTPTQDGYILDSVTVAMGGVDVTADVYSDGVITIPSVTGNVVITATSVENTDIPVYRLASPTTFDGTADTVIDTGVDITSEIAPMSVYINLTTTHTAQGTGDLFAMSSGTGNTYAILRANWGNTWSWQSFSYGNSISDSIDSARFVVTLDGVKYGETRVYKAYKAVDGALTTMDITTNNLKSTEGSSICLGAKKSADGTLSSFFTGEILEFEVYKKALSEDKIKALLGVE